MCSDPTQPHCDAPRCDEWCAGDPATHCGRVECQCYFCAAAAAPQPSQVGGGSAGRSSERSAHATPVADGTCDQSYLWRIKSELTQMIDDQTAKNRALERALGNSLPPLPPPAASSPPGPPAPKPPPPPPCALAYTQCGGFNHNGPSGCCSGSRCHLYHEYYSGCVPNSISV
jgi:hypothetical protein